MATLALHGLSKNFGEGWVVKDVNLEVADSEFCVLVGASGSGKSTVLRMIAGLETVTQGDVFLDGALINGVRPGDRDMAMVFQNYALYAHMDVAANLGYSLRIRGIPKDERIRAVHGVAESLQITQLLSRKPRNLSGGERQRVALGRAIIRHPRIFLMDEPLSNLDALLRVQMRTEILRLQRELGTTTVYVTHDQVEAMSMADKLVLLHNGVVEQIGTPSEIYERPANRYVASFVGSPVMNFIEPGLMRSDGQSCYFECKDFVAKLPKEVVAAMQGPSADPSKGAVLGLRAEAVAMAGMHPEWEDSLTVRATVKLTQNLGSHVIAFSDIGHQMIAASVDSSTRVREGDLVTLKLDMKRAHLFDGSSGQSLLLGGHAGE